MSEVRFYRAEIIVRDETGPRMLATRSRVTWSEAVHEGAERALNLNPGESLTVTLRLREDS